MRMQRDERDQPHRNTWLRDQLDVVAHDLRYNARIIRREGPLSIAVVLSLIIGVGINSVVFAPPLGSFDEWPKRPLVPEQTASLDPACWSPCGMACCLVS